MQVYVAYDGFANLVVPPAFFDLPPTIKVRRHPVVASPFRLFRNSGRDHRKLLVVDHDVAFVGGYNIGSLYATDWRDTHARLTGDIVWDMRNAFIDYWNLFTGDRAGRRCPTPAATTGSPRSGCTATCRGCWSTRSATCTWTPSTARPGTST